MTNLLTGGNVHTHERDQRTPTVIKSLFLISGMMGVAALALTGMLLAEPNINGTAELDDTMVTTVISIDHALAHGTTLTHVIQNQRTYIDHTFKNMHLTITTGSCGTTANNAYTITGTNANQNLSIYTSTTDTTLDGTTSTRASLMKQVCQP